jgi:putative hydrolase
MPGGQTPGGMPWQGFDLAQLMRMLQSEGPVNWEVATQVAGWIALADPDAGQSIEPAPVEPATAGAFEDLVRATQPAVADATSLSQVHAITSVVLDRRAWADATLHALEPVLLALASKLQAPLTDLAAEEQESGTTDPLAALVPMLAPILLGVQAGSMVGFLAQHALGQYDLPLPLQGEPVMRFVAANVDAFAADWTLPLDELRYAVVLREVVHAAQRTVPWVRDRLVRLSCSYVEAYELRVDALEEHFGNLDPTRLADLTDAGPLADPDALLGAMRTERQAPLLEDLQRFVSVLEGYADVVVESLGAQMIPAFDRIDEALRRHRVERGQAAAFVDRLLGLELDRDHYEQGVAFWHGVVERAGTEGLHRVWGDEARVPTRTEVEAPGLWLARLEL